MKRFGQFLREKRKTRGIKTAGLGLDHSTILRLETQNKFPNLGTFIRIAAGFNMPAWKLLREFTLK